MNRIQARYVLVLTIALVAVTAMVIQAQPSKFATSPNTTPLKSGPTGGSPLGIVTLDWDDGTFEGGLGPTGGHYDGQFAMRFGGAAATTGLVPFRIRGAYFRLRSGNPGVTNVNINFWHPLTAGPPGFPASPAPVVQVPAGTTTGVTQQVTLSGPVINTANGSVIVGVGGLGTTNWFIDRDTNGPDNNREFAGSSSNNTLALSYGPTTLGGLGFSGNYFVRLQVDGNVPVELETFTVE
ncbi:MAG: hypothetical protein GY778_26260 [bacterium]|nr:hypothetical protein [bacterium]